MSANEEPTPKQSDVQSEGEEEEEKDKVEVKVLKEIDPFACFDDCDSSIDDDDEDEDEDEENEEAIPESPSVSDEAGSDAQKATTASASEATAGEGSSRDRTCGILSFHTKTESALLFHVRNAMSEKSSANASIPSSSLIGNADRVLLAIDEFCQNRHWMMHIGPEKGNDILINEGLNRALQTYLLDIVIKGVQATAVASTQGSVTPSKKDSFIAVEMGTYCGYSSILLGKTLKIAVKEFGINAHIYSVEIDPHVAEVANEMIQMAGLHDMITVVLLGDNQDGTAGDVTEENSMLPGGNEDVSVNILQESVLPQDCNKIDFLFLDHDKFLYLPSFLAFQRADLLKKGSIVVADNVLFAGIMDYVAYVRELQNQGVVQTKTIESRIEYWTEKELLEAGEDTLRDGVGKNDF